MHEHLIVHIASEPWAWYLADRDGKVHRRGSGNPPTDQARRTTVLVDMADCLALTAELPDISGSRLRQALPWAIEEQIAGNVEDQHVVPAGRDEDNRVRALVVARERIRAWLEALTEAGLKPAAMLPDALCLPAPDPAVHLLPRGERVLMRSGPWAAASLEASLLEDLAPELAESPLVWHGEQPPAWASGAGLDMQTSGAGPEILISGAVQAPANLLEGEFAPDSARRHRKLWIAAAALAGAVVLAQILVAATEYWQLNRQSEQLQSTIDERYRAAFPDAGRLVAGRERELAERELARLRFGEAAGMIDLLSRTVPVLSGSDTAAVRSVNYRDGSLEIRLTAQDVSQLDQLEGRLRAVGLGARVQSASLGPDGADGRLEIREAGQ